jgi:hypothetical protein
MSLPSSTGLEHLAGIQIVIQHLAEHFHSISKFLAGQIAHEPVSFGIESGNYLRPFRFSFSFRDLTERDRVSYSPNRIDADKFHEGRLVMARQNPYVFRPVVREISLEYAVLLRKTCFAVNEITFPLLDPFIFPHRTEQWEHNFWFAVQQDCVP